LSAVQVAEHLAGRLVALLDALCHRACDRTLQDLGEAAGDTRYAGPFRIELREDGTYETQQTLDGTQSGEYRAAPGDFLVFKDDTGCDYSGKFSGTSVYRWSVDGDELTLTLVRPESGGCTGRSDTLTLPRWERE